MFFFGCCIFCLVVLGFDLFFFSLFFFFSLLVFWSGLNVVFFVFFSLCFFHLLLWLVFLRCFFNGLCGGGGGGGLTSDT